MKQKVIIGFSLALLLFAVYLIAHDLFRRTPSHAVACCGDEEPSFKNFDSTLLGYTRITVIETG
jgi:hypothetical protein